MRSAGKSRRAVGKFRRSRRPQRACCKIQSKYPLARNPGPRCNSGSRRCNRYQYGAQLERDLRRAQTEKPGAADGRSDHGSQAGLRGALPKLPRRKRRRQRRESPRTIGCPRRFHGQADDEPPNRRRAFLANHPRPIAHARIRGQAHRATALAAGRLHPNFCSKMSPRRLYRGYFIFESASETSLISGSDGMS
jgi:hypothetical protein